MRADLAAGALLGPLLAGCAPDFAAALHLTLAGDGAGAGGGYWLELRTPDGVALPGTEARFADYHQGEQDVTLLLERDDSLVRDTVIARVLVRAVTAREAAASARGSTLVTLRRHQVSESRVTLASDPRPLGSSASARLTGGSAPGDQGLELEVTAAVPEGETLHAWVEGGAGSAWLARIAADGTPAPIEPDATLRQRIGGEDLGLALTLEPPESPEPLSRASGWIGWRGRMPAPLVRAGLARSGGAVGYLQAMGILAAVAQSHFALAQQAFDAGSAAGVREHAEHVVATVAGAAVAESASGGGLLGDLDASGSITYVTTDRSGLGLGTVDAPGYSRQLADDLVALESVPLDVSVAAVCATHLRQATEDVVATATALAATPLDTDALGAFAEATSRLNGDPFDAASAPSSDRQSLLCVGEALRALSVVPLAPVPAGVD